MQNELIDTIKKRRNKITKILSIVIKSLSILLEVIIITSCNQSKNPRVVDNKSVNSPDLPYFIDIEKNLTETKSVPLSNIGKELEYIPLETNPNCMIERIEHISFSEDFIFIADYTKILQFDRKGKFLRQIGVNGRGPGEYTGITGFCIDQKNGKVFVNQCNAGCEILEYDFNGSFIKSFNQPWRSYQFIAYDTTGIIFYLTHDNDSTVYSNYNFYITDHEFHPIYKIKRYFIRKSNIAARLIPLYYHKNILHFKQYTVDTLYTLENEKPKPYAIFKLGKSKLDPNIMFDGRNPNVNQMIKEVANYFEISKILENENYLFTNLAFGIADSSKYCVFNKNSSETTIIEDGGFKNDIDAGIRFWPKYIYNDSILIDYVDAFEFLSMLKNGESNSSKRTDKNRIDKLEILKMNLTETSNPVLIILK